MTITFHISTADLACWPIRMPPERVSLELLALEYSILIILRYLKQLISGPGLHFSYREHGLAWDKLDFIDEVMYSGGGGTVQPESLPKTRDVDLALSTLVYAKRFWAGVTVDHLLTPNVSLYAEKTLVPVKVAVFGGVELVRKSRLLKPVEETMTLAYLFKKQGPYNQLDLGVYWHKNPLVLGLWYRGIPPFNSQRGDALIILIGYKTQNFNIGYSYDVTISNLIGQALGSHEVSMSVKFATSPPHQKRRGSLSGVLISIFQCFFLL